MNKIIEKLKEFLKEKPRKFGIGDKVVLKTGGPTMIVVAQMKDPNMGYIVVNVTTWFNSMNEKQNGHFRDEVLELVLGVAG